MAASHKWKSNLLSSGLPLEFDVSKLLASRDYDVSADYVYGRQDAGTPKDFSVDLSALRVFKISDEPTRWGAGLRLLIECKQRIPDTKWLFFPRVSRIQPYEPATFDNVRVIDEFFYHEADWSSVQNFSTSLPVAIKGTEVNVAKGDVYDKEIRHGIAQLQYALPAYVRQLLRSMALYPSTMFVPYLFCPILLTTAELYMVRDGTTLSSFEQIDDLGELAVRVPYLSYAATIGPDFQRHSAQQGEGLAKEWREEALAQLDRRASERARPRYGRNASAILREVEAGQGGIVDRYYEYIVVCSHADFGPFLDALERAVDIAAKTLL